MGNDLRLWYYFNDGENSEALFPGKIVPDLISKENWNKTPLHYDKFAYGPMAFDTVNGDLYYMGSQIINPKLNRVVRINADYPVDCILTSSTTDDYVSYRNGKVDSDTLNTVIVANTREAPKSTLRVFPNPSENSFTFQINKENSSDRIMISVEDITGKTVYKTERNAFENDTKITWDATEVNNGVYFYNVSIEGKKTFFGKLIKI
jgi:WD40 repeat protein